MAMSEMTGPDGERDEPWGNEASGGGAGDEPIELTEIEPAEAVPADDAARLNLDDDDPPLPWLQGDDDDADFEGSGIGQTVGFVVLGLLAIALVVGGIWFVTKKSSGDELLADGSTIEAPKQPYKSKPENPGGKVFAGTGDTSFGISEGQKRPARLGEEPAPKPGFTPPEKTGTPAAAASDKPADVPGVGVQVAAYSNMQQAEDGWKNLSGKYEALSGVKHRVVQGQADIGTVYRLQAVAPDAAAARTLCGKLKSAGLNCQVKN